MTVFSGPTGSNFSAVAVDSSNNIFVAGDQLGTGTYVYQPQFLTGANTQNPILLKYDTSGSAVWGQTTSSVPPPNAAGGNAQFRSLSLDSSGNIYAGGYQQAYYWKYGDKTVYGGCSSGASCQNAVVVKYNGSGTVQWATTVASASNNTAFQEVVHDSSGNLYAVGYIYGNTAATFGSQSVQGSRYPTGNNILIVKYR